MKRWRFTDVNHENINAGKHCREKRWPRFIFNFQLRLKLYYVLIYLILTYIPILISNFLRLDYVNISLNKGRVRPWYPQT